MGVELKCYIYRTRIKPDCAEKHQSTFEYKKRYLMNLFCLFNMVQKVMCLGYVLLYSNGTALTGGLDTFSSVNFIVTCLRLI